MKPEFEKFEIPEKKSLGELPEDYWFKIIKRLAKESGEVPDPIEIRAEALCEGLRIPHGPYSALEKPKEGETEEEWKEKRKRDGIIAEYLTNKPGVVIDKETGIISSDFRDLYPEGLPKELKRVLDPATREIMEIEYEHRDYVKSKFGDTKDHIEADNPVHYFRLLGGIDLFLRGYTHHPKWQKNHGGFLKEMNKEAMVICIEGFPDRPYGESLVLSWGDPSYQLGDYDVLMKDAMEVGFPGVFTEVDARQSKTKIAMDNIRSSLLPKLPFDFYENFFKYLKRENSSLTQTIKCPEELKENLIAQSMTLEGMRKKRKEVLHKGIHHLNYPYLAKEGKTSFEPTYQELGQCLFTDALASIKLHLVAKLMNDGYLEKGPIIDYEGTGHLPTKTFFLKYPQYATVVVLRMVNELMAGKIEELSEIYKVFENPNWEEIVKEICKLTFKKPEGGELKDVPIDFFETYNIDPEKVIPSDKEIKEIREKIARLKEE